eukprot:COSAG06_NODE_38007_length_428_cov_1.012158_1_plen_53_part_01
MAEADERARVGELHPLQQHLCATQTNDNNKKEKKNKKEKEKHAEWLSTHVAPP